MLVAPQFSRIQNREVTTYLVNCREKGTFYCSIQQAIDKAEPYSRIAIASGQYLESISVPKPIELVGDDGENPIICGHGVCLSVAGAEIECYFENLRIIYKGSYASHLHHAAVQGGSTSKGMNSSVRIIAGRPTFFQCEMSSLFVGGNCLPMVQNCTITGNMMGCGLIVAEEAGGTYRQNIISNHIPFCVSVSCRGDALFEENDISQDLKTIKELAGLGLVNHGGTVVISREHSEIDRRVAPKFINNRIRDDGGVTNNSSSSSSFAAVSQWTSYNPDHDSTIFAERSTVRVDPMTSPEFIDNYISGGLVGVNVLTGGAGNFNSNTITNMALYGVMLGRYSIPTFRSNAINRCATGILAESTSGTVRGNIVKDNLGTGLLLLVADGDIFRIEENGFIGNDTGVSIQPAPKNHSSSAKGGESSRENIPTKMLTYLEEEHKRILAAEEEEFAKKQAEQQVLNEKRKSTVGSSSPSSVKTRGGHADTNTNMMDATNNNETPSADHLCRTSAVLSKNIVGYNKSVGVMVLGSGCNVTLTDVEIINNGKYGAFCSFGSTPLFQSVTFDQGPVGILVERTAQPTVYKCKFTGHGTSAVIVRDRGRGNFIGNLMTSFSKSGILIEDGGFPTIVDNHIHAAAASAVLVTTGGVGIIESNNIESVTNGIEITTFGDPVVKKNKFTMCSDMGVYVHDQGIGTIIDNTFMRCSIGCGISAGGEPTIRQNVIKESTRVGVIAGDGSLALIEKNMISESLVGNVLLEGKECGSVLLKNIVERSGGFGIRSTDSAKGVVKGNKVHSNRDGGLGTQEKGNTEFRDNIVHGERGPGIRVGRGGNGHFINNMVENGNMCGLELCDKSNAMIEKCCFLKNAKDGIQALHGSGGVVRNCEVSKNLRGIRFAGAKCISSTVFEELLISENVEEGVYMPKDSAGQLYACEIQNQPVGARFDGSGQGNIEDSKITNNEIGVVFSRYSEGKVMGCVFECNNVCDVEFQTGGTGLVDKCKLQGQSQYGVKTSAESKGVVQNSMITQMSESGVYVGSQGQTTFINNEICCNQHGVICIAHARGLFLKNNICKSIEANVKMLPGSDTEFNENCIQESEDVGMIIQTVGGKIRKNKICKNSRHGIIFETGEAKGKAMAIAKKVAVTAALSGTTAKGKGAEGDATGGDGSPKGGPSKKVSFKGASKVSKRDSSPQDSNILPGYGAENTKSTTAKGGGMKSICEENTIEENEGCGIEFADHSTADIFANIIQRNKTGGILIRAAAPCIRKKNMILENQGGGIILEARSSAEIHGNKIFKNTPCNVDLKENSLGEVEENEICEGDTHGIVANGSATSVHKNTIHANTEGSGLFLTSANPHMRVTENTFTGNNIGIYCNPNGSSAIILKNKFTRNNLCAIRVGGTSMPTIEENLFDIGNIAIELSTDSAGKIIKNKFFSHKEGISVNGDPIFTFCSENYFEKNGYGICFRQNETYKLERNDFGPNEEAGVALEESSRTSICYNRFVEGHRGILAVGFTAPTILNNSFIGCQKGVELIHRAQGRVEKNTFHYCDNGMVVSSNDRGVICVSNVFVQCATAGFVSENGASPSVVHRNLFTQCRQEKACAILLRDDGGGNFSENDIHKCRIGIIGTESSKGKLSRCLIHNCDEFGALFEMKSSTTVTNCVFLGNIKGDCVSRNYGAPLLKNCCFTCTKPHPSLQLIDHGAGTFSNNIFKSSNMEGPRDGTAILLDGAGVGVVCNNLIAHCNVGCLMRGSSSLSCSFSSNVVQDCDRGILTTMDGGADCSSNYITACDIGVLSEKHACARISSNTITKNTKFGILVKGAGNVEFNNNLITENATVGVNIALGNKVEKSHFMVENASISEVGGQQSTAVLEQPFSGSGETDNEPRETASTSPRRKEQTTTHTDSSFGQQQNLKSPTIEESPTYRRHSTANNPAEDEIPIFMENIISHHHRINLQIGNGEVIFKRNFIHSSERGVMILPEANSSLESNTVFGNVTCGVECQSRNCSFRTNTFASPTTSGAWACEPEVCFELRAEWGNTIYNSEALRAIPPSNFAPTKPAELVDPKGLVKNFVGALAHTLTSMHQSELPDFPGMLGCELIPGSLDRTETRTWVHIESAEGERIDKLASSALNIAVQDAQTAEGNITAHKGRRKSLASPTGDRRGSKVGFQRRRSSQAAESRRQSVKSPPGDEQKVNVRPPRKPSLRPRY